MAALVLGAICQAGDRTPWLAAILADRYRAPAIVIAAAAIALGLNYTLGAIGGMLIAPMLSPEARAVLLGLALVLAGAGTAFRLRAPDRLDGWRLGATGTSVLGLVIMAFGDRMQFVVAALAARSTVPWLAAVGATLGALAVTVPAIVLGEARWQALPLRMIAIVTAGILIAAGIVIALGGLSLI